MVEFVIKGGKKLEGEIEVRGAKNSALKILPAALLFSNPLVVKNIPLIEDVFRTLDLLGALGVRSKKTGERSVEQDPRTLGGATLKKDIAERFRGSIVLAGPLLTRRKKIYFPHPGGSVIGKRPIDIF